MPQRIMLNLTCGFLVMAVCFVTGGASFGQEDDDPFRSSGDDKSAWGSDNESDKGGWRGTAAVIDDRDRITSGGAGCPIIVVGNAVFDSGSFERLAELDADYHSNDETILSGDGSLFAVVTHDYVDDERYATVQVFDTKTGKQLSQLKDIDENLSFVRIARNKYVLTGNRENPEVMVWNAEDGELVQKLILYNDPDERLDEDAFTVSKDGHYIAAVVDDQLVVYQVAKSGIVATMEPPKLVYPDHHPQADTRSSRNDATFIYAWIQNLKFSPDGLELAAISSHRGDRLLCWNQNAKLVINRTYSIAPDAEASDSDNFQWLPDQNAWLVNGNLIDRESGNVLMAFHEPFATDVEVFVRDQDTIIGRISSKTSQLQSVAIPWEDIRKAQQAMADEVPALVAPYQPVDVRVEFGKIRGSQSETAKQIVDSLTKRMAQNGIPVEAGAKNYFRIRLTEGQGETLPIYERDSPFDFRGRDTGRKATLAKGSLVAEFFVDGKQAPVWNQAFDATSGTSYTEAINATTIRESMLRQLLHDLSNLDFPYFMPVDENILSLPIIIR